MKKMLAVMLAAATVMSVGVTAFADDVNILEDLTNESSAISSEEASSEATSSEATSSEATSSEATSSEETSSEVTPVGDPSQFIFGADEDGVILGDDLLEPGTEYKFPVSVVIGDQTVPMTEDMLKDFKLSYSKVNVKGMERFEIEEYKDTYYLYVEAKSATLTKPVEVKYNVKYVRKSNNLSLFTQEVKFEYGYTEANNDYIDGLDEGDEVEIDNDNPVITDKQFETIAKINNYRNVTLVGNGWKFTVNVTDESSKNLVFSNAGIKEILAKFPDQDFKFFSFAGKPTFAATGRVELDIDDIVDDFEKIYTYRYADGKLYRINATFDADENTLTFRTNRLDTFIVTDKLIEDGFVVTENTNDNTNDETDDKTNPSTGANNMIPAAVMAAMVALGAVCVKTKKSSK